MSKLSLSSFPQVGQRFKNRNMLVPVAELSNQQVCQKGDMVSVVRGIYSPLLVILGRDKIHCGFSRK